MRLLLALFAALPAAAGSLPAQSAQRGALAPKPSGFDVLVVVADDVAVEDLQEAFTPTLDLLAAGSRVFTRAYANPTCSPSRHALYLGRWRSAGGPRSCKVDGDSDVIAKRSLAYLLRDAGYATGLFGKWHCGSGRPWRTAPLQAGFDVWRAGLPNNVTACEAANPFEALGYRNYVRVDDGVVTDTSTEYHTVAVRDTFIEWWNATPGPRLGVLAFQAPHGPFHRPVPELLPAAYPDPSTDREKYLAMLTSLDTALAQIVAAVDLSNTVVVLLGDNGTPPQVVEGAESGRVKGTTFERGIHVPLFVAGPGIEPGVDDRLAHLVDVYATVLRLAGVERRADGRDLLAPATRDFVLCGREETDDRCAVSRRYKLRSVGGVEELYDLEADPGETVNRVADPALREVLAQHRGWLRQIP